MKNKISLTFLTLIYFVGIFTVRRGFMWILSSPRLSINATDLKEAEFYSIMLAACFWFLLPAIIFSAIQLGREQPKEQNEPT